MMRDNNAVAVASGKPCYHRQPTEGDAGLSSTTVPVPASRLLAFSTFLKYSNQRHRAQVEPYTLNPSAQPASPRSGRSDNRRTDPNTHVTILQHLEHRIFSDLPPPPTRSPAPQTTVTRTLQRRWAFTDPACSTSRLCRCSRRRITIPRVQGRLCSGCNAAHRH